MTSLKDSIKASVDEVKKKYPSMEVTYGRGPTREETKARVGARNKAQKASRLGADTKNIAALEKQYAEIQANYSKGKNWARADREQNLSPEEQQSRSMESGMNDLGSRIDAVKRGTSSYAKGGKVSTCGKNKSSPSW